MNEIHDDLDTVSDCLCYNVVPSLAETPAKNKTVGESKSKPVPMTSRLQQTQEQTTHH